MVQQPQERELFGDPHSLGQEKIALGTDPVEVRHHPIGGGTGGPAVCLIAETPGNLIGVENTVRTVEVIDTPVDLVPEGFGLVGLVHVGAGHFDDFLPCSRPVAELLRVRRDEDGPLHHPALGEVVGECQVRGCFTIDDAPGLLGQERHVEPQVVPAAAVPYRVPQSRVVCVVGSECVLDHAHRLRVESGLGVPAGPALVGLTLRVETSLVNVRHVVGPEQLLLALPLPQGLDVLNPRLPEAAGD